LYYDYQKLTIAGATRNKEDVEILNKLKRRMIAEKLENYIDFMENASREKIVNMLAQSHIGIHTMKFEHFGISIVEMMASGCPVVAHNSAGAKFDIIKEGNTHGILAEDTEEFVEAIKSCVKDQKYYRTLQNNALSRANEFTAEAFKQNFINIFDPKNK
jgi:alpha-1,2-mannosyltransferase